MFLGNMASNISVLLVGASLVLHGAKAFVPVTSAPNNNNINKNNNLNRCQAGMITPLSSTKLCMSPPDRSRNGFSTRKNPLKFLRIYPRSSRNNKQRVFELQTAVATMTKKFDDGTEIKVDLHAQLHFGEKGYFQFYNDKQFDEKYDNVFYELIVSDSLLHTGKDGSRRLLPVTSDLIDTGDLRPTDNPNPITPSPSDESTASSYGLTCQINVVDYTKTKWIHCDVTREDYLSFLSPSHAPDVIQQPIWALSSTSMSPIQEYASALVRPSTPSSTKTSISQFSSTRLFSNLFLPGANLASALRILLWVLSPSPEVSILLLDWSSIVNPKPSGMISPIFVPCLESLLSGNLLNARKLIFAQLLVSGQTAAGQDLNLVQRRNSIALDILMKKIDPPTRSSGSSNAILYGAMHCQDLQSRLEKMGFSLKKVEWRKVWSVNVPTFGIGQSPIMGKNQRFQTGSDKNPLFTSDFVSANSSNDIAVGLVVVPIYLLIGGFDWLGTVGDLAQAIDESSWNEAVAVALFYILRHLALYMGLAKFVIEWDGERNLFTK